MGQIKLLNICFFLLLGWLYIYIETNHAPRRVQLVYIYIYIFNVDTKESESGVESRESVFFQGVGVGSQESERPGSRSRESESVGKAADSQALISK